MRKIIFFVLTLGSFSVSNAQKIAYVNLDSLMGSMPETKMAKEVVANYLKTLEGEMLAMQTELENKYKDYMEKKETMSEPIKQNKEQDINQLQKRLEDFKVQAGIDMQKKQTEFGVPIFKKIKKGIEAAAKEGGYKYVLNVNPNGNDVLYSEPSENIFSAVKKKLDAMPPAILPTVSGNDKSPNVQKNTENQKK